MGKSEYNNFIRDYQTVRDVLKEIFIYGCYKDVKIIEKLNISQRKLEKEFQRLRFYMENKIRKERNEYHSKIYGFSYDCYKNGNYLYNIYGMKSVEMNYFNRYILILQLLEKYKTIEIKDINQLSDGRVDCDLVALKKMIKEMIELGIVQEEGEKTGIIKLTEDLFEDCSKQELLCLYCATELYEKNIYCSTVGFFLRDTLKHYLQSKFQESLHYDNYMICGYDFLFQVLNDEVTYEIGKAISKKEILEFEEANKKEGNEKVEMLPLKIIEEYLYGRQYVYGIDCKTGCGKNWRIEKIKNIKKGSGRLNSGQKEIEKELVKTKNSWNVGIVGKQETAEKIGIEFTWGEGEEYILYRLEKEKQWGTITRISENQVLFEICVNQSRELIPWIRSYGKYAKVVEGDKLKQDLKNSWEEMWKQYENISEK